MPGRDFAHVLDDVNALILCIFEGTFSLDTDIVNIELEKIFHILLAIRISKLCLWEILNLEDDMYL